jgi:predicted transcriptional regulator
VVEIVGGTGSTGVVVSDDLPMSPAIVFVVGEASSVLARWIATIGISVVVVVAESQAKVIDDFVFGG